MTDHKIADRENWLTARRALLDKEKEFTRLRDELAAERRRLPWEVVEKEYVFDGPDGRETLAAAHRVSLHVRAGLGGRLSQLFILGG